jgi:DnaJ-class molecular chaperone
MQDINPYQQHGSAYAVKCSQCTGGYIGMEICPFCHGDGSIAITERKPTARWAVYTACALWLIIIGLGAWLIVKAH